MTTVSSRADGAWESKLRHELPLLGHRNWIVIADSAYPLQNAAGIETVYAEGDQLQVLKTVLAQLGKARHVVPVVLTDAELEFVLEKDAAGIDAYRRGLHEILGHRRRQVLPHEQIIGKLDEAGKTFHVLLIKTPLAIPYTSVFLQLECGYWSPEAEQRLREAMKSASDKAR